MHTWNIGTYLAHRLAETGLRDYFTVPGDFNLVLLDQLLKQPGLRMVGCCNELNAGYAADGYARESGFGAVCFTFTVGGRSLINAAAGAYSDDLPVLFISGGPNSNDGPARHRLHHTIGHFDFDQVSRAFHNVVAKVVIVRHPDDAALQIDDAIRTCLACKKPVYLEIACNLASHEVAAPSPITLPPLQASSDPAALAAAIDALAARIESAVKPVLIAGSKIRAAHAAPGFDALADALGCAIAVMPDAKGLVRESHPAFMGTYWASASSPVCAEIVQSSDCQIFVGPVFNDYTTTGWTALIPPSKRIHIGPDFVRLEGRVFSGVHMADVLEALRGRVPVRDASLVAFRRFHEAPQPEPVPPAGAALTNREIRRQLQGLLSSDSSLVVETGDSWFNGQKLRLPDGCGYHFQMQYGSIGWATGAALGVSVAAEARGRRAVLLTGDGSFQLTGQEVSTMLRYNTKAIIFLINNRGYTIEVEIHDGPYNNIQNWDYAGLVKTLAADGSNGIAFRATNGDELQAAIAAAQSHDGLVFIECRIDRDDCTMELLEWGSRVATANSRA